MNDLTTRSLWNFPSITLPSFVDEIEDLFPTLNVFNGLSLSEDEKKVYVEASVPGIDPKEVDITFSKGVLTIRAEKKEDEKGKTYHRRASKSFLYRISPRDIDPNVEPEATYKNGTMTIAFTKAAMPKAKKITVKTV